MVCTKKEYKHKNKSTLRDQVVAILGSCKLVYFLGKSLGTILIFHRNSTGFNPWKFTKEK